MAHELITTNPHDGRMTYEYTNSEFSNNVVTVNSLSEVPESFKKEFVSMIKDFGYNVETRIINGRYFDYMLNVESVMNLKPKTQWNWFESVKPRRIK